MNIIQNIKFTKSVDFSISDVEVSDEIARGINLLVNKYNGEWDDSRVFGDDEKYIAAAIEYLTVERDEHYAYGMSCCIIDVDMHDTKHIVHQILFDAVRNGKLYKDIELYWDDGEDVDELYIMSDDGPWCMAQVGNEMIDFQPYCEEGDDEIKLAACLMKPSSQTVNGNMELCWGRGDFLSTIGPDAEITIKNIRVIYND